VSDDGIGAEGRGRVEHLERPGSALTKDELDLCSAFGRVDVHDGAVSPSQLGDGRDLVLMEDVGGVRPEAAAKSEAGVGV
jgi:hypothetical protein